MAIENVIDSRNSTNHRLT